MTTTAWLGLAVMIVSENDTSAATMAIGNRLSKSASDATGSTNPGSPAGT